MSSLRCRASKPVWHEAFGGKFGVLAAVGGFLTGWLLLLLIAVLIARTGLRLLGATFGLAVLAFAGAALGEDAPVAGAFHAVNAVLVLGIALFLTVRAWRGNLLIPRAQLRRTAPAPKPAVRRLRP